MAEFMELFKAPQFKAYGSSLKLLMVAEGEAHVYPR
jgi:3'-phosphoadenosine 5'-phosphosulfate (PAPS) 3'-phosphatase